MNKKRYIAIAGSLALLVQTNSPAQTITAWTFDSLAVGQNQSPAPSTGSGLVTPLGMSNTYNGVSNQTTNFCDVLSDPGSSGGGANAWRVRGGWNGANPPNGWSTNAPIASQGAQFDVSTAGYNTNIVITFDLHTTAQSEANLAVLYTTDGINWTNSFMVLTNAGSANATVESTNTAKTVSGSFFRCRDATAPWYNNLTATITNTAARNNANFGIRLVNASTGSECINQSGGPYNSSSGNWRYDNVAISAAGGGKAVVAFTPGNLVVYRIGNGISPLSSTGNVVFLDEYTTNGAFVQSVPLPSAQSGSNSAFVASGTSRSEGGLSLSTNGLYLLATGYATNLQFGSSLADSSSVTVPRLVARVDYAGNIDTTTALKNWSSGNNPHSAVSPEGFNLWVAGSTGSVAFTTLGSTSVTVLNTNAPSDIERLGIYGAQLYAMTDKGTNGLYAIGTGLPTTGNQLATTLAGLPGNGALSNNSAAGYSFVFLTLRAGASSIDTLYYADDGREGENGNRGGILKYSLVSGTWTSNGTINAFGASGLTAKRQIAGSTTNVLLYATSTNNALFAMVDSTGYNGNPSAVAVTTLTNAPANTAFRDVAFAPVFGTAECAFALDTTQINAPVSGGIAFTFDVTANSTQCTWSASTDVGWITGLFPSSTNGSATVTFNLSSNAGGLVRTGHVVAAGLTNTIVQTGATNVAFTAGNLVVVRAGDGIGDLSSSGNPIFLDEYTTAGTLVQSIPLPTTFYSGNYPFTISGTARTEGGLSLTADGRYLLAAGYGDTTPGATVPGVVARVNSDGNVDTSTFLTNWISGNPRDAVSPDGTNIWLGCNGLGVGFTTFGSHFQTALVTNMGGWNIERVGIYGGRVYGMTGKTTNGLYSIGTGLPTTGNQLATILPGMPGFGTSGSLKGDGFKFVFFTLQAGSTNFDTLYYADDGNNGEFGGYGGVLKYSLISGTWTITGTGGGDGTGTIGAFGDDIGRTPRISGLTGKLQIVGSTTNVLLYATSFSNNVIYAVTDDTGFNGDPSGLTLTTLVGPTTNQSIRDIAFVPTNSGAAAPPNPFVTWQSHYFTLAELGNPSFSGPNADPLGKGISNTNQFLAGFNPTNSAAYLDIISIAKTNNTDIKVIYLGANGDSTYPGGPTSRTNVLEYTTGTANGSYTNNFASTGQTNVLSSGSGLGVVANMVDSGGATNKPSKYYRVRVLVP